MSEYRYGRRYHLLSRARDQIIYARWEIHEGLVLPHLRGETVGKKAQPRRDVAALVFQRAARDLREAMDTAPARSQ